MMKIRRITLMLFATCLAIAFVGGSAHAATDLSGTWVLNSQKGENLPMGGKIEETIVVAQTAEQLTLDYTDVVFGNTSTRQVIYDLTGAIVDNVAAMIGPSKTASNWDGDKLVTTWTTPSAVPGNEIVRIETHALSDDGTELTVTSERANKPNMVMVFEKQ